MRYNARVCRSYAGNTLAFFITIAHWYAHAVSYVRLPLHLWQEKKKERDGEKRKKQRNNTHVNSEYQRARVGTISRCMNCSVTS